MNRPRLSSRRSAARSSAAARSATGVAAQAGKPACAAAIAASAMASSPSRTRPIGAAVDRRDHRALDAGKVDAVDQRRSLRIDRHGGAHIRQQRREACAVAELDAHRIAPLRPIEIARQRNFRMPRVTRVGDPALRPAQNIADRHTGIRRDRHERGIGAVLQQPPHQIGQQIAVAADRRVDAAGDVGQFGEERLVERLAHAVQALEFVSLDAAGVLDDARDGERIVRGELRKDARAQRQQFAHAGHVAEVGHGLAGEHRIIGEPALLRALDLGVPIGALDQPHGEPAAARLRRVRDPVDHLRRALLIGLHREAEALPAAQRGIGQHGADHVERQFEPVGLLGIDGELQVVRLAPCARARAGAARAPPARARARSPRSADAAPRA